MGSCEVCAPGSAWEVCHSQSPANPPPRATEGNCPASFAGFTQSLGVWSWLMEGRLEAREGSVHSALSPAPHLQRKRAPLLRLSVWDTGGCTQGPHKGGPEPTWARPAQGGF